MLREQVAVELATTGQALPHLPQLATEDSTTTSQPFSGSWSQSPRPGSHRRPHSPPAHVAMEPGPEGQTLSQLPQVAAVPAMSVSQPLAMSPSQSPKPSSQ